MPQRLVHGPRRRHDDELRRHDAARARRRIGEEQLQSIAGRSIEDLEEPGPVGLFQLAKEIGLLVGGHRLDQRDGATLFEQLEDVAPSIELRLVEKLHREIEGQRGDDARGRLDRELVERLGDIRAAGGSRRRRGGLPRRRPAGRAAQEMAGQVVSASDLRIAPAILRGGTVTWRNGGRRPDIQSSSGRVY